MKAGVTNRWTVILVLAGFFIGIPGCKNRNNQIEVTVRNIAETELSDVCVTLASTTRTINTLKPGASVQVAFPVLSGEGSFSVSAKCSSGKLIKRNVGYVDHSVRDSKILFRDSKDSENIGIYAE